MIKTYNIKDYCLNGNEGIFNMQAVQKAVDECSANGGGIV